MYVPYIASGMLDEKDTTYFNVKGVQINDPSINDDNTMIEGIIPPSKRSFGLVLII